MRYLLLVLMVFSLSFSRVYAQQDHVVTLIHLSDYHSHALPFYADGQSDVAGVARVLAYLQPYAADPETLIFSGGDTMNMSTPAWSDKYTCLEWQWFNGVLDAMAYGNHDSDYGPEVFADCRSQIQYPVLGSNVLDAAGDPLFIYDGNTYQVFEVDGAKIGVFAVAGSDFPRLVRPELLPAPQASFTDRVAVASEVVQQLREQEQVDAVVLIGHALYEDDLALAQAVPGIDLILGTHSHRLQPLMTIDGTNTRYIAPFQYLTYLSKVELVFDAAHKLVDVRGDLVAMTPDLPEDPTIKAQVAQLQADLEADPLYAPLFEQIGSASVELATLNQFVDEALLGNFVMDIVRHDAQVHLALATASSFREPIAPGVITEEALRTAMPYPNKVLVYEMSGKTIQDLLNFSLSRAGSDFFSQVSGVRFEIVNGQATQVKILRDPADPSTFVMLDPQQTYLVATSDFQSQIAGGYKDFFNGLTGTDSGLEVREQVRRFIRAGSPITATLDGRMSDGSVVSPLPGQLPDTSGHVFYGTWLLLAFGCCLGGWLLRTSLCRRWL